MKLKSDLHRLILIAIVAFVVFANSLSGDFVYAELVRKDEAKLVLQAYLRLTAKMQDNVILRDHQQAVNLLKQLQ